MSSLPARMDRSEVRKVKSNVMAASVSCMFCDNSGQDYYTCPKCNSAYCSLVCYRSPRHSQCSEAFYKQCVQEEMKLLSSESDNKSKKVVTDALKRLNESEEFDEPDPDDDEDL